MSVDLEELRRLAEAIADYEKIIDVIVGDSNESGRIPLMIEKPNKEICWVELGTPTKLKKKFVQLVRESGLYKVQELPIRIAK